MSKTRSMLKKILIAIVIIGIVAGSIYLCFQFGLFDDKLTATYDTTHTVYVGDEVDSIKPYLTVNKANWLGSKTEVSDYALSGDFYHLIVFGKLSAYICQKDLITQGTIEDFEKLFEGKIVRKVNNK